MSREDSTVVGQKDYAKGEVIESFFDAQGLEPRLALTYLLNDKQSLKISYNRMRQYIHLISNTATTPIDIWRPSGRHIDPATADQFSLGYFAGIWQLWENRFDFSVESYYKSMNQIVDYKDGADLIFNERIETELLSGKGRAYGLELLRKNSGKWTGWISAPFPAPNGWWTELSKASRSTKGLVPGELRQDPRHQPGSHL